LHLTHLRAQNRVFVGDHTAQHAMVKGTFLMSTLLLLMILMILGADNVSEWWSRFVDGVDVG
jgi:hypothetical protein